MINFYQSIKELGVVGRFDTEEQIEKIGLPKDLSGMSVLDIGCNTGAFLLEAYKRGATELVGEEINDIWRWLGNGMMMELDVPIRIYRKVRNDHKFDVVLLLSITHVVEGMTGQDILDRAYKMTKKLLIVEINDRLQKEKLVLPREAVFYGKNKDDRSIYQIVKDHSNE